MGKLLAWLIKFLLTLVLIFVVIPLLVVFTAQYAADHMEDDTGGSKPTVAVVELTNEIVSTKAVVKELYKQSENSKVVGIVLRIDSPGGGVGASQDVYSAVKALKLKKPIVASMGGVAASGGLYSALSASKIFCQPGTITGSIGVILQFPNFTRVADKIGAYMTTVKSGKLKDAGNPFREVSPEDLTYLQGTIDAAYEDFLGAVIESRGLERDKILPYADGRIILGKDAKTLGIVDDFGDVYQAAYAAAELAGKKLPAGEYPRIIYPMDKFGSIRELVQGVSDLMSRVQPKFELRYSLF